MASAVTLARDSREEHRSIQTFWFTVFAYALNSCSCAPGTESL